MTTEEKKIDLIGKIINLENDKIIDMVNELLNGTREEAGLRKAGWGKGMVNYVSKDFDDFIPPGFS
jgi:hypothetical protein